MKKDLELQLQKKYPKILKDLYGDEMKTCMAFGLECGDGWYALLDQCMAKIQLFCDLCSKNGREVQLVAAQIKAKYATLRFYVDIYGANELEQEILYDIVDKAERLSDNTCEVCGKHGKTYAKGWHVTLCYEHALESGKLEK